MSVRSLNFMPTQHTYHVLNMYLFLITDLCVLDTNLMVS